MAAAAITLVFSAHGFPLNKGYRHYCFFNTPSSDLYSSATALAAKE